MNEETIKELLSINYIRVIAEREGFIVTKVEQDFGDDILIKEVEKSATKVGFSFLTTGRQIGVQVKCTTQKSITSKEEIIKFRLKGRNYYHLSLRKKRWKDNNYIPLILILLVLPIDETEWLNLNFNEGGLTIGGKAYWYIPPDLPKATLEKTSYTISILKENQLNLDSISELFKFIFKDTII